MRVANGLASVVVRFCTVPLGPKIIVPLETKMYSIIRNSLYNGVYVIASHILHEICLLIGKLAIRGTTLALMLA